MPHKVCHLLFPVSVCSFQPTRASKRSERSICFPPPPPTESLTSALETVLILVWLNTCCSYLSGLNMDHLLSLHLFTSGDQGFEAVILLCSESWWACLLSYEGPPPIPTCNWRATSCFPSVVDSFVFAFFVYRDLNAAGQPDKDFIFKTVSEHRTGSNIVATQ